MSSGSVIAQDAERRPGMGGVTYQGVEEGKSGWLMAAPPLAFPLFAWVSPPMTCSLRAHGTQWKRKWARGSNGLDKFIATQAAFTGHCNSSYANGTHVALCSYFSLHIGWK